MEAGVPTPVSWIVYRLSMPSVQSGGALGNTIASREHSNTVPSPTTSWEAEAVKGGGASFRDAKLKMLVCDEDIVVCEMWVLC